MTTNNLDINVLLAIIASIITIIGYFISKHIEKSKIIEQQIRNQKLPVYEEFINFLIETTKKTKTNKPISDKEIKEIGIFFTKMNVNSILWLSDKTLKSYSNWKNELITFSNIETQSNHDISKVFHSLETLILDIRKDIGHKNKNINKGDILSLFINDLHKINYPNSINKQ